MSILETVKKGTLSFQVEEDVYQKFLPRTEAELVSTSNGKNLETLITEILNTKLNAKSTLDLIYPVGSIYMSANNVNPSSLFKGTTWEAFGQGRTLVGKASEGTFATLGTTGGETTRSIKVNAHTHIISHTHTIASHTHTIAHTHTVNAHSHSISHTHGIAAHSHAIGNTALTTAQLTSHTHGFNGTNGHRDAFGVTSAGNGGGTYSGYVSIAYNGEGSVGNEAAGGSGSHNHSCSNREMTTNGASVGSSGNASPATGGASSANSGGSGTLTSGNASASSSGSGGAQSIAVDVTQPYIVVNMWKRTA